LVDRELANFFRFRAVEERLARLTGSAYERDFRVCLALLTEDGIELLGSIRPPATCATFPRHRAKRRPAFGD
jgi:hypothetical protein